MRCKKIKHTISHFQLFRNIVQTVFIQKRQNNLVTIDIGIIVYQILHVPTPCISCFMIYIFNRFGFEMLGLRFQHECFVR